MMLTIFHSTSLITLAVTSFVLFTANVASALSSDHRHNYEYKHSTTIPKQTETATGILPRRRFFLQTATVTTTLVATTTTAASASDPKKSRTDGYAIQHSEREWAYMLSGAQYNILRRGGTERQRSSILNTFSSEANIGTYVCAGCDTPLFSSADKFDSGTGWPSFAAQLSSNNVEVEELDPIRATLNGREVRCRTCGGHLGDLFNDGMLFVGSSAAKTGKRYCIDGAALIFKPADGGAEIMGDQPPPNKVIQYEAATYRQS